MSYVEATSTHAVIYLEWDQVHSTRVALAPCTCRATKSNSTQEVRERLSKALAFAETNRAGAVRYPSPTQSMIIGESHNE